MDKVVYREPRAALVALLAAAIEGPQEGEWIGSVSFGRFDDSVNRGESYYWSLSVSRSYGNTRSGRAEQAIADRLTLCLDAYADWQRREAQKAQPDAGETA